jgi:hypothetical protein
LLAGRIGDISSVSVALLPQETLLTPAKTEQVGKKECGGKKGRPQQKRRKDQHGKVGLPD